MFDVGLRLRRAYGSERCSTFATLPARRALQLGEANPSFGGFAFAVSAFSASTPQLPCRAVALAKALQLLNFFNFSFSAFQLSAFHLTPYISHMAVQSEPPRVLRIAASFLSHFSVSAFQHFSFPYQSLSRFSVSAFQRFSFPFKALTSLGRGRSRIRRDRSIKHQTSNIKHEPASGFTLPELGGRYRAFTLPQVRGRFCAFTLIELLVVITIIVILLGMLFPAFRGVQNQAKKAQAKNDITQIVTAVNAYYTEYGRYPIDLTFGATDVEYGNPDSPLHPNSDVMNALRAIADSGPNSGNALNPRKVVFFQGTPVKDAAHPRAGFDANGEFWDPWGSPTDASSKIGHYIINLDGNFDGVTQVYTLNYTDLTYDTTTGGNGVRTGVIAASLGSDGSYGTKQGAAPNGDYKFKGSDDVLSWQ